MSTTNDGGPAFPREYGSKGMSLRDYFAAAALQGLCADPSMQESSEVLSELAYNLAAAMLKERAK